MQALVLAGGEGTRLRPLTLTVPKPIMPLAGRPFLSFMIEWLARHGVDDCLLSCGFMAERVEAVIGSEHAGTRLRYVVEREPLGTAGPVRLAYNEGLLEERFLVLNGDVLTNIDLTAEIEQHERTGATATLALVAVEDPSTYGAVPTSPAGEVEAFLEKMPDPPTGRINAGAYVIERDPVAERIASGRAVSFELDVFPALVGEGLYGFQAEAYWIDIGTPRRYLEATWGLLGGAVESSLPARDQSGSLVYPPAAVAGARVGPLTVLGSGSEVGAGSLVERAVLHDNVRVGADCVVRESVLGEGVEVGFGAAIEPGAMVGSGASIAIGARVPGGARVAPGEHVR